MRCRRGGRTWTCTSARGPEHEITKILQLVSQLAEQVGVLETNSLELAELKRDVAPEKVLDKIQERSSQSR
jgi:hypothetical protein